jgi:hypothetical protein
MHYPDSDHERVAVLVLAKPYCQPNLTYTMYIGQNFLPELMCMIHISQNVVPRLIHVNILATR